MTAVYIDGVKQEYAPKAPPRVATARATASTEEATLWQALDEVEDPEYPVSVVEMGLVYKILLDQGTAHVDLSFTSMGCPCMEYIIEDVQERLLAEPSVSDVKLDVVWDPPWTRKMLTPSGAEKLKQWGIVV
ncbi:MAG: metal-sulfur cluster assembly factor [Chloroflexota bacterium]